MTTSLPPCRYPVPPASRLQACDCGGQFTPGLVERASKCHGDEQDEKTLYLEKVPVADDDSTIAFEVDGEPYEACIDPFNELIDRVRDDNRARVTRK